MSIPSLRHINPPELYEPPAYYSQVVTTTGPCHTVATAGQVGCDETGVFPEDVGDQIALALENLARALEAGGATVKDVYKLVYYLPNYDPNNPIHEKHLETFLKGHRPATTLVPVPALALPQAKFEIEAYAAVRQEPLRNVDVVVVGAGLSGLKAAWEVQKAGFSCVVVEARDRVGGRTYSVDPLGDGRTVDLGGAWINDTNQSEIHKLAQTLGLELVVQTTDGDVVYEDSEGGLSRAGYGVIPDSPEGVLVSAARGDFRCKRLIFSAQTILYNSVAFDPPLPPSKLELSKHNVQSFSYKHVIIYAEPWWRAVGLSGAFMSFKGPISTSRDTSSDQKGQFSLTCFANGRFGPP
ncbi:hypothetical protein ACJ41O_015035 [Fusarium nematophilum]